MPVVLPHRDNAGHKMQYHESRLSSACWTSTAHCSCSGAARRDGLDRLLSSMAQPNAISTQRQPAKPLALSETCSRLRMAAHGDCICHERADCREDCPSAYDFNMPEIQGFRIQRLDAVTMAESIEATSVLHRVTKSPSIFSAVAS
jgi:hypothetical protein